MPKARQQWRRSGARNVTLKQKQQQPRKSADEHQKRVHIIMLNLARRHLEPWQWGQAFKMLLEESGIRRGKGGDRKSKTIIGVDSVESVAAELGIPERAARHRLALTDAFDALSPKEQEAVRERKTTVAKVAREQRKEKNTAAIRNAVIPKNKTWTVTSQQGVVIPSDKILKSVSE